MAMDAGTTAALLANGSSRTLESATRIASLGAAMGKNRALTEAQSAQAARDFEALFIGHMVEQMFGESIGEDLFGDKDTQEIYKGLLVEEYGRQIANSGGIGIAGYVKKELLKLQEVTS